ncbi:hypothetical protein Cni_G02406 [Canna indica]|uniref:Uncharacterized protein n=1 Tax=Canna indica TaxID=4628 RepID=A0AAQ3JQ26_9LILI|nr:hypothetical protein Cni_G02406 [Canna indica]
MQPRLSHPSPYPNPTSTPVPLPNAPHLELEAAAPSPAAASMFSTSSPHLRGPYHRRARSELTFRFPNDLGGDDAVAAGSIDEIGSEDDLFCTFLDIEKIGSKLEPSGSGSEALDCTDRTAESSACGEETKVGVAPGAAASRPKHRHSCSVDGSSMTSSATMKREAVFGEVLEAKKVMTAKRLRS